MATVTSTKTNVPTNQGNADANKQLVRRLIEESFNKGNLTVIDQILAPNYIDHNPAPGQNPGVAGVREFTQMVRKAFPDVRLTIEEMLADGDKVVTRWSGKGTHKGEFAGIPASNAKTTITGIQIDRVKDGRVVETWHEENNLGMFQQMGAIDLPMD